MQRLVQTTASVYAVRVYVITLYIVTHLEIIASEIAAHSLHFEHKCSQVGRINRISRRLSLTNVVQTWSPL